MREAAAAGPAVGPAAAEEGLRAARARGRRALEAARTFSVFGVGKRLIARISPVATHAPAPPQGGNQLRNQIQGLAQDGSF